MCWHYMDECKPRAAGVWGKGNQTSNWKIKYTGTHFWAGHPFVTRAADHSVSWDIFILVLWTTVSWYNPSGENERKIYLWVPTVPHLSKCPLLGCETFYPFMMHDPYFQAASGKCVPQWVQTCQFWRQQGVLHGPNDLLSAAGTVQG